MNDGRTSIMKENESIIVKKRLRKSRAHGLIDNLERLGLDPNLMIEALSLKT